MRLEDGRLLAGRGRYLADVRLHAPGSPVLVHACFARSPHAHAAIEGIDTAAARALPGVHAVLTAADLPHRPLVDTVAIDGLVKTPQPALAADRVRFLGEPVVIVVAESRAVAEDAADLVRVAYRPLQPVVDPSAGTVIYHGSREYGDVDAAFASAAHVLSGRFTTGRFVAAPMETRGCLASYAGGRLTVHSSTQSPHLLRRKLAACLDLPEDRIRVLVPDVGGGFGQKIPAAPEEVAVALAARATGLPVSWVEDRRENITAAPHAKDQAIDVELAVGADGTFEAVRARILGDAGAYSFNSASALIEAYLSAGLLPGPYRIPAVAWEVTVALTNKSPVSPYRGVGWTASHSAREVLIDRAARLLGRDPVELRRQNLVTEFPYRSATGMVYDSGSYLESLDKAAKLVDYPSVRARQATDGRLVGVGVSPYVEPSGWGSAGARESAWPFASQDTVRVTLATDGSVTVLAGTPSQGQGHATTLAAVVAAELGVPPSTVRVVAGDTDATPASSAGTRASRTATVTGGAVALACRDLRARLAAGESPPLTAQRSYDPPATYANGCVAVVVEVDPDTGGVTILQAAAVEDCGTMLDPTIVEGQVLGAVAQGIGGALYEHIGYDEDGVPSATSFADYLLPTAVEVPPVRLDHCVSPSPLTVNGVKGMGESGVIATPGAVACAVADALARYGVEVDRTPLTPEYVASLIAD